MGATGTSVLVLTADKVGERMAGPAIRAVELSRVLASTNAVTLASTHSIDLADMPFATATFTERLDLEPLVDRADVVIAMSALLDRFDWIANHDVTIVADAYDPAVFEVLAWFSSAPLAEQDARFLDSLSQMVEPLRYADVVLCASERQRHLVIGMLTALGRLNPRTYGRDPAFDRLVSVVPFGLPAEPPTASSQPLRGATGPFEPGDTVLLWGGGIYEWLDPLTLVEAVALTPDPTVKAFFAGGSHPTPEVPDMPLAERVRERASDLGLLGGRVVFADSWIPYEQRADLLLDSNIGVSLHRRTIETTFAFRTRMLDYLWAALPVLVADGDSFADLVRDRGLGVVTVPGDPASVAAAVEQLRDPRMVDRCRTALHATAAEFQWTAVAQPVLDLCAHPTRAADRQHAGRARPVEVVPAGSGGLLGALDRVAGRLRSRFTEPG
jgi:glycosyltransferase involved in cell wall biosynthesis